MRCNDACCAEDRESKRARASVGRRKTSKKNLERSEPASLNEFVTNVMDRGLHVLTSVSHCLSQVRELIEEGGQEIQVVDGKDKPEAEVAKRLLSNAQVGLQLSPQQPHIFAALCRQLKVLTTGASCWPR